MSFFVNLIQATNFPKVFSCRAHMWISMKTILFMNSFMDLIEWQVYKWGQISAQMIQTVLETLLKQIFGF